MKRLSVTRISGVLLFGAISILANSAIGQYNSPTQPGTERRPLNQLPPIVSSQQSQQKAVATPRKGLFLPPSVKNLPPIVTSEQQAGQPFVYSNQPNTPQDNTKSVSLPPIVQGSPSAKASTLPPIVSGGRPPAGQPNQLTRPQSSNPLTPRILQPTVAPSLPTTVQTDPPKSKAGVPIYSRSSVITSNPTFAPTTQGSDSRNLQGSGSRSLPSVITRSPAGLNQQADQGNSSAPSDLPTLPPIEIDETGVVDSDASLIDNSARSLGSTGIVESSGPITGSPGTNNFFDQSNSVAVPGAPVDVGCSNCGPGGCYDLATVQAQNGCCGAVVNAGYYMFADALFWSRGDGDVQLSTFFGLNDFNFVGGARLTLGYRENATQGRELTYFGTGQLDESQTQTSAGGLQPIFGTTGGLSLPTGFLNANLHTQTKESQLHSLEYNRIKWGWDLLKTFVGVRYIYFDDSVSFFGTSSNAGNPNAFLTQDSVNNLFGAHGGWELFYDVGYRTSASFSSKFGAYVNTANVDTNLFNFGSQLLNQEEDDATIASTIELNVMSHFQISPRSRFRAGYDLFLGWGLFTVSNNIPRSTDLGTVQLTPLTGTDLNTNNEPVVFHGPSFGFEIFR